MPPTTIAVLDTNVALDCLVFRDPRAEPLLAALQGGRLCWLACPSMRRELAHMAAHPTLARWGHEPDAALARFDALAEMRPEPPPCSPALRCNDADDQVFLDLALAHGARWLLTHDRALLKLARRAAARGLAIASPARWPGAPQGGAGTAVVSGRRPGT